MCGYHPSNDDECLKRVNVSGVSELRGTEKVKLKNEEAKNANIRQIMSK